MRSEPQKRDERVVVNQNRQDYEVYLLYYVTHEKTHSEVSRSTKL